MKKRTHSNKRSDHMIFLESIFTEKAQKVWEIGKTRASFKAFKEHV